MEFPHLFPTEPEEAGFDSFNVIAATFYEHYDDILNFYNNRASNAAAESFNSKIKLWDSRYLVGIGIYFGKPKKKETFIYNSS